MCGTRSYLYSRNPISRYSSWSVYQHHNIPTHFGSRSMGTSISLMVSLSHEFSFASTPTPTSLTLFEATAPSRVVPCRVSSVWPAAMFSSPFSSANVSLWPFRSSKIQNPWSSSTGPEQLQLNTIVTSLPSRESFLTAILGPPIALSGISRLRLHTDEMPSALTVQLPFWS
ncbi:hypothetical protein FVEG_15574 [Fusarium verticillioides 7600]|uniref:Uncharacterized protein n=1 Tax=Gibberella moniliformis (strain M3125 / FGSC 7600) TaxID=334819 RepID=W7M7C8_GIBM7|nr:hypothetical protein FVEG_15574 [Fusarium verticillioides 7600]XP_018749692.1 hypothetical protein FVEG_15574 [Fusarium verticillioides 7600]EWG43500.1 hypothetical protein FVEG_15574 [Fusarium verticillioides 7600]EWG43501.1 hypothetical protein FVEG_15574 [Fusarium verticillioides 7600]